MTIEGNHMGDNDDRGSGVYEKNRVHENNRSPENRAPGGARAEHSSGDRDVEGGRYGYREGGYREGGYREGGNREGGNREGGNREGGNREERRAGAMEVIVEHNIEKAMKILKRKLIKEGIFKELKSRRYFEKPSEKRKRKEKESIKKIRKEEARSKKNPYLL